MKRKFDTHDSPTLFLYRRKFRRISVAIARVTLALICYFDSVCLCQLDTKLKVDKKAFSRVITMCEENISVAVVSVHKAREVCQISES